ncbi:daunorubicin resistance protein DrrA family ABC transporter ATP-binding protein [Hoyosella subflava]|uniref:Daunorubicin resistance ABC transporter ATPase subunit n=1 Tax=Hoyosella subflava (strain DSM 45089 / JCM 17490 / NBRC 109087 / DQS3-9A1) TaxID=443218 RepID=F6EL15_HOYSD|nr:daunorubicin resistance protein DrrA family ABC transporter ATP-binding protein [Hoyosella subflava]AEF42678.1 Daunorubicin resistance ABC transporter ATPase subunit [Hoyosella subflava DQS3-9A1]
MIKARGLAQTFLTGQGREKKEVHAVKEVNLDVAEGEIVAFLGPNGAGKTTTLRMLTTLLKPTRGEAKVAGYDIGLEPEQVRRNIGYVSQSGSTASVARAGEEVMDHGMLYGISRAEAERRGKYLFEQLNLDGLWKRQPKAMSGGQRRRLDIAMGLVHEPRLLFLDEPTTGLDPQARANLWEHIRDLREKRGATIFLTTHYLDEADALSDRVIIIDNGEIVASDTANTLKSKVSGELIDLEIAEAGKVQAAAETLGALTPADLGSVEIEGQRVRSRVRNAGKEMQTLMRELDVRGVHLTSIEVRKPTLDDVFLTLTGRSLRDDDLSSGERL